MLEQNCRIENLNGFKFYEKDVLYDNYVFTNDIELNIDVTYVTPGFGVALMDNESTSIREKNDIYLFKIGYKEASIYHTTKENAVLVKQIVFPNAVTIQEHLKFSFIKNSKKIIIKANNKKIFEEYIAKDFDKYNIGYYSNANNIINNITMKANIPDGWVVNMENTQGGYINFMANSFILKDCINLAEIEQQNIRLKAGTYYLKLKTEGDIKYYVHESDDDRLFDDEKNILKKDNSFTLLKETLINLKFVGTHGKVSNILLSNNFLDDYIPTTKTNFDFPGSYLDIFIHDLDKVTWTGIVTRYPNDIEGKEFVYALIMDNSTKIKPQNTDILLNKEYKYVFSTSGYEFSIYDGKKRIYSKQLTNLSNKITIFKNISATISSLILYKKDGTEININIQDENKRYINGSINSPIIVTDEYNTPLDLSSSFRYDVDNDQYVFTNWAREYFTPDRILKVKNKILNKQDVVRVYGITKFAKINLDDIYNINKNKINSIDLLTKEYDNITEDIELIDKTRNFIYLNKRQVEKYKMFIVDYLKRDSYCINYHYDKNAYEVDISSLNKTKILYDCVDINSNVLQANDYKYTKINGNVNGYIVLEKGVN